MSNEMLLNPFNDATEKIIYDFQTFIQFSISDRQYALNIMHVNEIIEIPLITPYPQHEQGHIGIVNLSGQILPLIDYTNDYAQISREQHIKNCRQLLIARFSECYSFGLIISHPRRVEVPVSLLTSPIININHTPVHLLTQNDFISKGYQL